MIVTNHLINGNSTSITNYKEYNNINTYKFDKKCLEKHIYIYITKNELDNIFEKNNINDLEKSDHLNLKVPVDDIQEEDNDLTICLQNHLDIIK